MPVHAVESMALLASFSSLQWDQIQLTGDFQKFLAQTLNDFNEKPTSHFGDEFLIQVVAATGLFAGQGTPIATNVLAMSKDLIKLLNSKFFGVGFLIKIRYSGVFG
jgi:hypothetical protein